jgi:predicted dinucleotide-binding enzyme
MRIGIIGAGQIGTTAAVVLTRAGHQVLVGSRRLPAVLDPDVDGHEDPAIQIGNVEQAARFGDVVVLAVPYGAYRTLAPTVLRGRIVVDATNYFAERDARSPPSTTGRPPRVSCCRATSPTSAS